MSHAPHQSTTQTVITHLSAAGTALIDINPSPGDGTGSASFRFFRSTNTSGTVQFTIFIGDGTATAQHFFSAKASSYMQKETGNLSIGRSTTAITKLYVDQASTTAADSVIVLDQADLSEEFIEFVSATIAEGNSIEAVGSKVLTTTHFIKVLIPGGLIRYITVGTIATP